MLRVFEFWAHIAKSTHVRTCRTFCSSLRSANLQLIQRNALLYCLSQTVPADSKALLGPSRVLPTEDGLWVSFDERPLINDSAEKHAMFRHLPASTTSAAASAAAATAASLSAAPASAGDAKAGTAASTSAVAATAATGASGLETKQEGKQAAKVEAKQPEQKEKRPYFIRACSAEVQVLSI